MTEAQTDQAPAPGRRTSISKDPIGVDPIGYDPLDLSDSPPRQTEGQQNRTLLGWTANATSVFIAAVVLGVIFVIAIIYFAVGT